MWCGSGGEVLRLKFKEGKRVSRLKSYRFKIFNYPQKWRFLHQKWGKF